MSDTSILSNPARDYRRGVFFVIAAGVMWSTVGLGIRLIENADVWQILFYRSCSLAPFLYVVLWLRSKGHPLARVRKAGWPAVVGGLALVGAYAGGITAMQITTIANAMLLFAAAPFFAAILGRIFLGESVRRASVLAMVVAIIGIAIMVSGGFSQGALSGNLAALGSALGFAIFTVSLRWRKTEDMMPTVFLSGIFAIVITGTICLFIGLPFVLSVQDTSIALLMGVGQVGIGLVLYTLGSKTVPAAELALLSLAEVLLGPLWVWIFLGETVGFSTLFGGSVLLAAIIGNAASGLKRRPPAMPLP